MELIGAARFIVHFLALGARAYYFFSNSRALCLYLTIGSKNRCGGLVV